MSLANDLKKYIVAFLTDRGWTVWVNNSGKIQVGSHMVHLSPPDMGDVIGFDEWGGFVNIEVKIGKDILAKGQCDVLTKLATSKHGVACVARSKKQFEEWFRTCSQTV